MGQDTRAIIDAIHSGDLAKAEYENFPRCLDVCAVHGFGRVMLEDPVSTKAWVLMLDLWRVAVAAGVLQLFVAGNSHVHMQRPSMSTSKCPEEL